MTEPSPDKPKSVNDRLGGRQVDLILDQLESLPTLPEVATQLLHLTASDRSDAQQVISLIKADQSLTARILSLAARADNGLRKEARTISKAVLMLGFETVRSTVMSIKVFEMFGPTDAPSIGLDRREFWKHCVSVACAAELLATRTRLDIDPEEIFVCGLLHDIGKLALEQCLPKSYTRIVETCNSQYGNIADYERQIIGVDHTVAGRRLAQQWRLPPHVENVIWLHHQPVEALPEAVEGRRTIGLIQLADTLAREQRFGYSGNFTFPADSVRLAEQLGVGASAMTHVLDQLPTLIEQRAQMMGMGETTSESLFRSALASANEELGRLNRKFQRRANQAVAQAKGLAVMKRFNASLSGAESLGGLCRRIADAWAEATGVKAEATASGAYLLSRSDHSAVVCRAGAEADGVGVDWIQTRQDLSEISAPGDGAGAESVFRRIASDAVIPDWVASSSLTHRPLVCGATWVGGVLWPAEAEGGTTVETLDALASMMATAASMIETRDRGNTLNEQLAQSSQQLYAAQAKLSETKALAAVGEMAAGAAHEINNPLAVIAGRAQLMADASDASDKATWRTVADQAQRMSDIVTEMMDFAKPPRPKKRVVSVLELLEATKRRYIADHDVRELAIAFEIANRTPPVFVDPDQVAEALVEVLVNAREAYDEKGHVRIDAEADAASGAVLLRVVDDGRGMAPETLDKAFTPFFSWRPAGRKRGMGLSRARRLVELAGGKIWINSTAGKGTVVFVLLPTAEDSAAKPLERPSED